MNVEENIFVYVSLFVGAEIYIYIKVNLRKIEKI